MVWFGDGGGELISTEKCARVALKQRERLFVVTLADIFQIEIRRLYKWSQYLFCLLKSIRPSTSSFVVKQCPGMLESGLRRLRDKGAEAKEGEGVYNV